MQGGVVFRTIKCPAHPGYRRPLERFRFRTFIEQQRVETGAKRQYAVVNDKAAVERLDGLVNIFRRKAQHARRMIGPAQADRPPASYNRNEKRRHVGDDKIDAAVFCVPRDIVSLAGPGIEPERARPAIGLGDKRTNRGKESAIGRGNHLVGVAKRIDEAGDNAVRVEYVLGDLIMLRLGETAQLLRIEIVIGRHLA